MTFPLEQGITEMQATGNANVQKTNKRTILLLRRHSESDAFPH